MRTRSRRRFELATPLVTISVISISRSKPRAESDVVLSAEDVVRARVQSDCSSPAISSSAVLTKPSSPAVRSGCWPVTNTPAGRTAHDRPSRRVHVVDLAPANDARVARRVHALDGFARLLARDERRG